MYIHNIRYIRLAPLPSLFWYVSRSRLDEMQQEFATSLIATLSSAFTLLSVDTQTRQQQKMSPCR